MNNIKMSELTMVGTWLHHWFPWTPHLNKYYAVHTYSNVTFLIHQCPFTSLTKGQRQIHHEAKVSGTLTCTGTFQCPRRGPCNVFTWFYIFVYFAIWKYFSLNGLSMINMCQLTNKNIIALKFVYAFSICQHL
jgi:hypothetical protein